MSSSSVNASVTASTMSAFIEVYRFRPFSSAASSTSRSRRSWAGRARTSSYSCSASVGPESSLLPLLPDDAVGLPPQAVRARTAAAVSVTARRVRGFRMDGLALSSDRWGRGDRGSVLERLAVGHDVLVGLVPGVGVVEQLLLGHGVGLVLLQRVVRALDRSDPEVV